jgi:hypothetical protein
MKRTYLLAVLALMMVNLVNGQQIAPNIITTDINNFWRAYDKIITTKDSAEQYTYLNQLFIDRGTPGLKAIMKNQNYTPKSYITAINQYPLFWRSIRPNMQKATKFAADINTDILKLKWLYPELKPAKIYFTVGAFGTGGTTMDSLVLIGSEIMLADDHVATTELPKTYDGLKTYFKSNPINIVAFTNVHEYVHTQQKNTVANTLLGQCILEGVAEFVAVKATGQASTLPALGYGKLHFDSVRMVFERQLFNPSNGFWLYNDAKNVFGVRDLGYYVGYDICERYYNGAANKQKAIKNMITLDYNDEAALMKFADESGYFSKPLQSLKTTFEKNRPIVSGIRPFSNNAQDVAPGITTITLTFSAPMDKHHRNFKLGPLGMDNLMKVKRFIAFSEDGKSASFEVELKSDMHYQLLIGEGFMNVDNTPLIPYLIDFRTGN